MQTKLVSILVLLPQPYRRDSDGLFLLTALVFAGIYVCPSCTTSTGRKTVSECHWSFSLTSPRASASHPASCSLVENMSITFHSIISRAFFPLMAHFCLSSPCVFKQSSAFCAFSSAPICMPLLHKLRFTSQSYEPMTRRSHLSVV